MRKKLRTPKKAIPSFAFVVDGECEIWYLQMLKRNERSINVNIEPKIPQKKNISEQYQIVRELSLDYSKVFWIIDLDAILLETRSSPKGNKTCLQTLLEYHRELSENSRNVFTIINNPCLEFWFLLHFKYTTKSFSTCNDVLKYLKTPKCLPKYEKTKKYFTKQDNDIYLQLKPYLQNAIANATKIGVFNPSNPERVIAEMYLLLDDLL